MTMELVAVRPDSPEAVARFFKLGEAYLAESNPPEGYDTARHLQAMLARTVGESHWLLMAVKDGEHIGFVEAALDQKTRPGWGFIAEFYVIPNRRGAGLGRGLFTAGWSRLRGCGAEAVWLRADEDAKGFWHALGFVETGELEFNQTVMMLRHE